MDPKEYKRRFEEVERAALCGRISVPSALARIAILTFEHAADGNFPSPETMVQAKAIMLNDGVGR